MPALAAVLSCAVGVLANAAELDVVGSRGSDGRIRIDGYGQLDGQFLAGWQPVETVEPLDHAEVDVGRLRAAVTAEWRWVSAQLEGDAVEAHALKDAWVGVRFGRALRLRVGNQKLPVSAEWLISARRIDFVRRSLPVKGLAPGRDWGASLRGELSRLEYEAGVFAGDGWQSRSRSQTTVAGRLLLTPFAGLSLGGSASLANVTAAPVVAGEAGDSRGLEGVSSAGFQYFGRKYVDGRRRRLGAEASFARGPFSVKSEYLEERDERRGQGAQLEDLPAVRGRGWAVSATALVAGERKKQRVRPVGSFPHGVGAIEIGARLDALHWGDLGPEDGFSGVGSRSRHLRPEGELAFTGGLSWWPVAWVRLEANVVVERFDDPLLVPEPGRRTYTTALTRLQLEVP